MKFCDKYGSLLEIKLNRKSGEYEYYCEVCKEFVGKPSQLIKRKRKYTDEQNYEILARAALYDRTYPKAIKYCGKCKKSGPFRYFLDKSTMKRVWVCLGCGSYWI